MESVDHVDEAEVGLVARCGLESGSVGNGEITFDSHGMKPQPSYPSMESVDHVDEAEVRLVARYGPDRGSVGKEMVSELWLAG